MYDMPLSDAVLVENGAYTSVNRIAREIERNGTLNAQYVANGKKLNEQIVKAAISAATDKYGTFRSKTLERSSRRTQPGILASKISSETWGAAHPKLVPIGERGRLQIAKFLGVLNAYRNAKARKQLLRSAALGKPSGMSFETVERVSKKGTKYTGKKFAKVGKGVIKYQGDRTSRAAARAAEAQSPAYQALLYGVDANVARRALRKELRKAGRQAEYATQRKQFNAAKGYDTTAFDAAIPRSATSRKKAATRAASASMMIDATTKTGKTVRRTLNQVLGMPQMYDAASVARARELKAGGARSNPFGYDDLALVTNPSGIGFLDSAESAVSNVPVVGEYVAPLVTPAVLGAAAFGVHYFAVPYVEKYLPSAAKPFAYTIGGSAVGIVSGVVAAKAQDSAVRNAAALIGGAAVAIGVGLDLFRKYGGGKAGDGDFGDEMGDGEFGDEMGALALDNPGVFGNEFGDEFGALALDNPGVFGALALDNPGVFGDGMAYQLGPVGGLGALGYEGASLADAYYSGADFDGAEGEAILAGPMEFRQQAGAVPRMAAGARSHTSHYAGRRYHRWGWLIKEIGYENVQRLAALEPSVRLPIIEQLRSRALQAYQAQVATRGGEFRQLPAGSAAGGPVAPGAAPGVGDALGYGALAVADY